jgi:hypothetical protein
MTDNTGAAAIRQGTTAIHPLIVRKVHQDAAFIRVKGVAGQAGVMD